MPAEGVHFSAFLSTMGLCFGEQSTKGLCFLGKQSTKGLCFFGKQSTKGLRNLVYKGLNYK